MVKKVKLQVGNENIEEVDHSCYVLKCKEGESIT